MTIKKAYVIPSPISPKISLFNIGDLSLCEMKDLINQSKKILENYKQDLDFAIKKKKLYENILKSNPNEYVKHSLNYYDKELKELCEKINTHKHFITNLKSTIEREKIENDN